MRYLLSILLITVSLSTVNAQKQANIWHFGTGQCLDFSSGAPVVVPGSAMTTFEGCASYCDKFGNLLMYTNGGGREPAFSGQDAGHIWNKNNAVMYDMQGVEGGGFSAVQSSVIFEAPGQDSVYYVFTMEEGEYYTGASAAIQAAQPLGRGLSYFTVDMRLNSGLGGVVLADQRLDTTSYEGLCAIRHANGRDYWVIIHQESMGLGVFSVTPAGVNFIGTYTGAGAPANFSIKAAPNGEKVVAYFAGLPGTSGTPQLLDFDNNTGQLSNPVPLSVPNFILSYEFSPNSRFLYTTQVNLSSVPTVESIVRFDLQAPSIVASATTLGNITTGSATSGFQLAPDGKIYFLAVDFLSSTNYINRIKCPNTIGATLELNLFTTVSAPNTFYLNLPNFPSWLFDNDDSTYVSLGPDTVDLCDVGGSYTLNALNPGATYLWSTGATTQSITVNTPGVYSVTVNDDCGTGTDRVVVVNCNTTTSPVNCDTTGNWFLFGNYDGGKLNIIVDQNIPNLKIGICTYEPVIVTFSGPFVGNITDVYYAGFNSSVNNNNCGFPITTTSFVGVNPALTTLDVIPPVNIISPPNPANIGNLPNGNNFGVVAVASCDVNTYQGGANTIDQVVDVFQTRFGGSLRGLKVQYCCWSDTLPYRLSNVSGRCCNTTPGIATLSYPPGPFCGGSGQVLPTLLGDSSGIFFATPSGLIIDRNTGVVNLSGSSPGTYEVFYALTENCITNLFNDTIVISSGSNSVSSISATACSSYTAPWGAVYTQSGTYNDTLTNVSGCDSIISVNLTITGAIIVPTITASACSAYTAPWGTTYTQSGTYSDTLAAASGCDSIISVNLTITGTIVTPPITASACSSYTAPWGTTYTQSGSYTDTLTSVNGCDSVVRVNLTITGSIIAPPITASACKTYTAPWGTTYTQSGSYTDTLTTVNGCDSVVRLNLTITGAILAPPFTTSACSSYTAPWGSSYTQSGSYTDTLTTLNGCDSIVRVNLTITGLPAINATTTADSCAEGVGTASVNASGGTAPYTYAWSNGAAGSQQVGLNGGFYNVTVTDQKGCTSTTQVTVTLISPPVVNVNLSSFSLLQGDSVQLNASGALTYQWTPSIGLSCSACPNPVATPLQTTVYTVTGTAANGCRAEATASIIVDIRCNELFVPTIFSPNSSGPAANEQLCVFSNCIAEMEFAIYDRWGKIIFETSNPNQCWDGTKDGKEVGTGVYAYRLFVKQLNGTTINKSGTITLTR